MSLLPEVCEGGAACRALIADAAKAQLYAEWEKALVNIQTELLNTVTMAKKKMERAYTDAFYCDDGCACQFMDNQFTYLRANIDSIDKQIAEQNQKIVDLQANIDNVHPECDFQYIDDQYQAEWAKSAKESEAQIAALNDWKSDDYELEDAVDQDAFFAKYGFNYDSSRFDHIYE